MTARFTVVGAFLMVVLSSCTAMKVHGSCCHRQAGRNGRFDCVWRPCSPQAQRCVCPKDKRTKCSNDESTSRNISLQVTTCSDCGGITGWEYEETPTR